MSSLEGLKIIRPSKQFIDVRIKIFMWWKGVIEASFSVDIFINAILFIS